MTALLAVSHGTSSPCGRTAVRALVDAVAARLPGTAVRLAHVDVEQPDVEAGIAALPAGERIVIVPLLLSTGYHVDVDLGDAVSRHPHAVLAPALGPDPAIADVLVRRLAESPAGHAPCRTAPVVLAAAGSSRERANADGRAMAGLLARRLGSPVRIGFLAKAEPSLEDAIAAVREEHPAGPPAVASYLLAPGHFHDLAGRHGPVSAPLLSPDAAPPGALVDLVVERFLSHTDRAT